jgi:hypothetical protein
MTKHKRKIIPKNAILAINEGKKKAVNSILEKVENEY